MSGGAQANSGVQARSASADSLSPFAELLKLQAAQRLPPVAEWQPTREGQIDIRIDREGVWHHEGARFERSALVRLFASILRKEDGSYFLVTPQEKLRITVEDAPLLAVECECAGQGGEQEILLRTYTDDVVRLDAEHAFWLREGPQGPRPYVHVRDGLNALVARAPYYQLIDLAEEADGRLWLRSAGTRFDLGAST